MPKQGPLFLGSRCHQFRGISQITASLFLFNLLLSICFSYNNCRGGHRKREQQRKHGLAVSTTERDAVLADGTLKLMVVEGTGSTYIQHQHASEKVLSLPPFPCTPRTMFFFAHQEHRRSIETAVLPRSLNPPNCHTTRRHCTTTMDCVATPSKTFASGWPRCTVVIDWPRFFQT